MSAEDAPSFVSGPVAVLPVSNLSGSMAPLHEIRRLTIGLLREHGFNILDENVLDRFMRKHRIRYVGGMDRDTAGALKTETGAAAALIISLEHFDEKPPPKLAMIFRLVSTGASPGILWMDSAGMSGNDSPGILDLGLIKDPGVLIEESVDRILSSLVNLKDASTSVPRQRTDTAQNGRSVLDAESSFDSDGFAGGFFGREEGRFGPKIYHRSSFEFDRDMKHTVAVLPFFNISEREHAGDIMQHHFLREMVNVQAVDPVEPGIVRNALLKSRVIMRDGISLDNARVIASMLRADFVLTGTVISYRDYTGEHGVPVVDFSVMLIERSSGETVWTSKSHNAGDDSVFFFDFGKVNTAHSMASGMSRAVVKMMFLP